MKVQARMEDKVRIKKLKSLLAFFEKFSREVVWLMDQLEARYYIIKLPAQTVYSCYALLS